jgi:hypothetical protein
MQSPSHQMSEAPYFVLQARLLLSAKNQSAGKQDNSFILEPGWIKQNIPFLNAGATYLTNPASL